MTAITEAPAQLDTVQYEVTVSKDDFLNIIANLPLFAGKDDTLPLLKAVRLEVLADGKLHGFSTDRYRMGEVRVDAEVEPELGYFFRATVSTDTLKAWLPAIKADKTALRVALTVTASRRLSDMPYQPETISYRLDSGTTGTASLVDGDYPRIHALWRDSFATTLHGEPVFTFNPVYLTDFGKVKDYAQGRTGRAPEALSMFLGGGNGKPAEVHMGDWFRGLIMPIRVPEGDSVKRFESWRNLGR